MTENLNEISKLKSETSGKGNEIQNISSSFKTLLGIGKFISGFGWFLCAAAVIAFFIGFTDVEDQARAALLGGGIIVFIYALLIVAFGQLISCFVSIEKNTRATYKILSTNK